MVEATPTVDDKTAAAKKESLPARSFIAEASGVGSMASGYATCTTSPSLFARAKRPNLTAKSTGTGESSLLLARTTTAALLTAVANRADSNAGKALTAGASVRLT